MALFRRILSLGTHASTDREIDAELREPMAMGIDDNMARGMSLEAAERDARRRFGNPTVMREHVSAEDAALGLESLWHDARSALRVFVKNPGFSFVVVATLALGIGTNRALFELLDAEAIAEAEGRPRMRFVPIKTGDQLDLQFPHRVRERWVMRRTAVIN